jgi:hypothetical protein
MSHNGSVLIFHQRASFTQPWLAIGSQILTRQAVMNGQSGLESGMDRSNPKRGANASISAEMGPQWPGAHDESELGGGSGRKAAWRQLF